MSAKKKTTSKSTALVPVEKRAIAALGLQHREKELVTLAAATAHIVTITNDDGYKQVDSARKALKRERLAIQKIGDETIEDAKQLVKLADAELTRLVGIIETEEDRLKTLQNARDIEIEARRQAEIDREVARQAALQERLAELRGNQSLSPTSGSALIAEHISDLAGIAVDESFEEFCEQAAAAKAEGLTRLRALWAAAVAHETEQRRIADERAELERLRKEAAERAAADAERERQAKVARDAEAVRHAAHLKQQAEEAAREQAARQKVIDDNNARIAAEQKAAQEKLNAERAEIERQQEELRKAREPSSPPTPTPVPVEGVWLLAPTVPAADDAGQPESHAEPSITDSIEITPPTRDELLAALTQYYGVDDDTVLLWLSSHDWRAALTELAA